MDRALEVMVKLSRILRHLGNGAVVAIVAMACENGPEPTRPHALTIVSSDITSALPGELAPEPLRVRVTDARDQPMGGVPVTWSVVDGQATVTPTTSTTDPDGIAATTVRLGERRAGAVVRASAPGVDPAIFTVEMADPCFSTQPMSVGGVITGTLRPDIDCMLTPELAFDFYGLSLGSQQALSFRISAPTFEAGFMLFAQAPSGRYLERASGRPAIDAQETTQTILLPAGHYHPSVTSFTGGSGSYQITAIPASADIARCEPPWILLGVTTVQQLEASDCADAPGPTYRDALWTVVWQGERIIISQSSSVFAPRLKLLRRTGELVRQADASVGGSAVIEFTADQSASYRIHATSVETQRTGAYTLALYRAP